MLYKSDYFPFFLKKKNNKQLLPMKMKKEIQPGSKKNIKCLKHFFSTNVLSLHICPHERYF
jgi:hypothetical protein